MSFDSLRNEVNDGMHGRNSGIPMGFNRLNHYVSIRKSTYYLFGGYTGSGKTSLVDDAFVLNPLDYLVRNKNAEVDLHIIYFSMERRRNFKLAKWISRKIFLDTGKVIPVIRLLGWVEKAKRINKEEYDLFESYEEYISYLLTKVDLFELPQNPTGIRKYCEEYALKNGSLDKTDPYKWIYTPNHPNKIVEVISDHIGLTRGESVKDPITKNVTVYPKGKPAIDKSSEDKQKLRDLYGFSPIDVQQFNRDISNPMRIKNGDVEPMLEDFKETGNVAENADVVISLFDPYRYKVQDPNGYNLDKLRDQENGRKMYRALKILKNTYGSDDIGIGLALQPEIGMFKEMPKKKDGPIADSVYRSILDNSYFLQEY